MLYSPVRAPPLTGARPTAAIPTPPPPVPKGSLCLPPIQDKSRYAFFSDIVMKRFITWGVLLMIVAIRHNVAAASGVVYPFCGATPSMRHYVEQCRMVPLLHGFCFTPGLCLLFRICARDGGPLRLLGVKFASYMDMIFSAFV